MPGVYEFTARHSIATQAVNIWHWQIPESNSVAEVQGIQTALDTFYTALASRYQTGVITIDALVRSVDKVNNVYVTGTTQTASTSGAAGAPLSLSAVLSLRSNLVGGSRRGRKFLGPLTATAVNSDGRTVASAVVTDIVAAAATLMAFNTNGVQLGVWSRRLNAFTPVTAVSCNPVIGTQRDRLT